MPPKPIEIELDSPSRRRLKIETGLFGANTKVSVDAQVIGTVNDAAELRGGVVFDLPSGESIALREHGWPIGRRLLVHVDDKLVHGGVDAPRAALFAAATAYLGMVALRQLVPILLAPADLEHVELRWAALAFSVALAPGIALGRRALLHAALVVLVLGTAAYPWANQPHVPSPYLRSAILDALAWFSVARAEYAIATLAPAPSSSSMGTADRDI